MTYEMTVTEYTIQTKDLTNAKAYSVYWGLFALSQR